MNTKEEDRKSKKSIDLSIINLSFLFFLSLQLVLFLFWFKDFVYT